MSNNKNLVQLKQGDLLRSNMQTLVNAVNCVGVMGKGIALTFKQQYPAMYWDYVQRCKHQQVKLGQPFIYKINDSRLILNFPTKNHWKQTSCLADIESGLICLTEHLAEWQISSLAIPALGCGNGGLKWQIVFPILMKYLQPCHIPIEIYAPV